MGRWMVKNMFVKGKEVVVFFCIVLKIFMRNLKRRYM